MLELGKFCDGCLCAICGFRPYCGILEGDTEWYCHELCKGNDGSMKQCIQFEKED